MWVGGREGLGYFFRRKASLLRYDTGWGDIEDSTRSMPEIESLWQMVCFHKHIESNLIHKLKEAKMVSKTIRFELCT